MTFASSTPRKTINEPADAQRDQKIVGVYRENVRLPAFNDLLMNPFRGLDLDGGNAASVRL